MKYLTAFFIVALLSFSNAWGSPESDLEAANAARDAAIVKNADGLAERADVDQAIGSQIIDLTKEDVDIKARLDALEAEKPVDPPIDPPVELFPWPVSLLDLDSGAAAHFTELVQSAASGNYTIVVDDVATAPVQFVINGEFCKDNEGREINPPFHACGDNNTAPLVSGANEILITDGDGKTVSFQLIIEQDGPVDPGDSVKPKIQVGDWYPYPGNPEEVYANIIRASAVNWSGGDWDTQKLFDAGFLSDVTGLPVRSPDGVTLTTDVFFTFEPRTIYDGDWVLEWDGKADVSLLYLDVKMITSSKPGRIEFSRDAASGKTPWHMAIQISNIDTPITDLRLFRAENEDAIKSGKIYNPRFVEAVRRYHVARSMDRQEVNRSAITRIEDVASMSACCWGNYTWVKGENDQGRPFRSMPLEALFALAIEVDIEIWHQVPLELGAPKQLHDPSIMTGDGGETLENWSDLARQNSDEILASAEWDRYADAFVAALIASGYPADRPLYSAISNEVWNFAGQYNASSRYAYGLGNGLRANGNFRHGLGAASARWKLALDAALARAGRAQAVVYVVEGQAANQSTTYDALVGMQSYMEGQGEIWADHAGDIGISVASYWGSKPAWPAFKTQAEWATAIANEPEGTAKAFADFYIDGPDSVLATKAWVLKQFAAHVAEGEKFGVKLIGAYEGGSHDERPSYVSKEWYEFYHWGEHGARVNTAVNDALAAAYPGIILSNYVLIGATGGQPWFDGAYHDDPANDNAMQKSWEKYQKVQ